MPHNLLSEIGVIMDIKRMFVLVAALFALLPISAQAERMNYAFVQIAPHLTDLDGGYDAKGDGFDIRGSWIYGPYVFSDIRYEDADLDGNGDSSRGLARIGIRTPIKLRVPYRLDIYGMLALEDIQIERTSGATKFEYLDDTGAGVVVGGRFGPLEFVELGAELSYTNFGGESGTFLGLEGIVNVSKWFALVGEYRIGTYDLDKFQNIDRQDATIALRWQFGGDPR